MSKDEIWPIRGDMSTCEHEIYFNQHVVLMKNGGLCTDFIFLLWYIEQKKLWIQWTEVQGIIQKILVSLYGYLHSAYMQNE